MKNILKLTPAMLVAGIISTTILFRPAKAEPPARSHAIAVLYMYEDANGGFIVGGVSLSGLGLPQIKLGDPIAKALNDLQEAGLSITPQSNPLHYTLVR